MRLPQVTDREWRLIEPAPAAGPSPWQTAPGRSALSQRVTAGDPAHAQPYWGLIRDASLDWKNSTLFFGRGVIPPLPAREPRGRYADRRREPAG
jgi:hypothetical protein